MSKCPICNDTGLAVVWNKTREISMKEPCSCQAGDAWKKEVLCHDSILSKFMQNETKCTACDKPNPEEKRVKTKTTIVPSCRVKDDCYEPGRDIYESHEVEPCDEAITDEITDTTIEEFLK